MQLLRRRRQLEKALADLYDEDLLPKKLVNSIRLEINKLHEKWKKETKPLARPPGRPKRVVVQALICGKEYCEKKAKKGFLYCHADHAPLTRYNSGNFD